MGKKLAIKGHPTRSNEVVELLRMLGGKDSNDFKCSKPNRFYYVLSEHICWDYIGFEEIDKYKIFTLEEFLEKFPFKVGDKVKYERINDFVGSITNARWDDSENQIIYEVEWNDAANSTLNYFAKVLQPYEETIDRKYNVEEYLKVWKETEIGLEVLVNDNFELKEDSGKFYIIKKQLQYPKTYEECCNILMGKTNVPPHIALINNFYKLLICRDAYWKMAGEQMGLGKSWEPDWKDGERNKYCIYCYGGDIQQHTLHQHNSILAFPNEELCDEFYRNFKDLIEKCKELL